MGYLVLQGSVPFRTAQFEHFLKRQARKRSGTRWAKYPFGYPVLQGSVPFGAAQVRHFLKLLARSRLGTPMRSSSGACFFSSAWPNAAGYGSSFSLIPEFPGRDSKPKKRLREDRAITHINNNTAHGVALSSRSLFLGLESLLGNSWI